MMSTEELRNKEVINVTDGRSLGHVCDIEVDLECGKIKGIVLPCERNFFRVFGNCEEDFIVKWEQITTIGDDVILVEIR